MSQQLIFTNEVAKAIDQIVGERHPSSVFIITDTNVSRDVLPRLTGDSRIVAGSQVITIPAGDESKTIETAVAVYRGLVEGKATRHSLIINLGGGVVTDLGGFVASTFKRGMSFVNVPTTLLGAVDAAVGGKTGVNFDSYKNLVGVFREADAVILSTIFFSTLPECELLSGYAEMVKHALLESPRAFADIITNPLDGDSTRLLSLLRENVAVKARIVAEDPTEKGLRKALNLGHTIGHALETFAMRRHKPIPHGYAVAYGLVIEAILSNMCAGFDSGLLHALATFVREHYGVFIFTCDDYPELLNDMRQDKKNADADHIIFTLLRTPGDILVDVAPGDDTIRTALDIFRDLQGI